MSEDSQHDTRHDTRHDNEQARDSRPPFSPARLWPLAVLGLGFAGFFLLGLDQYASLEAFKENHGIMIHWVESKGAVAVMIYMLGYAVAVAFSLPVGSLMTVAGGLLFGAYAAAAYAVAGATCGATILFLAAKTSLGEAMRARAGPRLRRLEAGFQQNAFNYLLVLRLMPVFPFWLINLAPAFLGVKLRTFFSATALGIIPGTFAYALFGAGLGGVLEEEGGLTLEGVLSPELIAALFAIALLALAPLFLKWWKGRRMAENKA